MSVKCFIIPCFRTYFFFLYFSCDHAALWGPLSITPSLCPLMELNLKEVMNYAGSRSSVLISYNQLWLFMISHDKLWPVMTCYELLWPFMTIKNQEWPGITSYDQFVKINHCPSHCTLLETGYGETTAIYLQESARNLMDQRSYNLIVSLVCLKLDCVQFDYIHWARLTHDKEYTQSQISN